MDIHDDTCAVNDGQCSRRPYTLKHIPDTDEWVCNTHHMRWYRLGDPRAVVKPATRKADIEDWVAKMLAADDDECWLWPFNVYVPPQSPWYKVGVWRNSTAPRVILTRKIGPPPTPQHEACHEVHCTGKPLCVNPNHLYWGTRQENIDDQYDEGTRVRGEKVWAAKLTEKQVLEIIASHATARELAAQYGLTVPAIGKIKTGKAWKHVDRSGLVPLRKPSKISDEVGLAVIKDPRSSIEIAADYGLGEATINAIKHGRMLAHLDRSEVVIRKRGGGGLISDEQAMDIIADERPQKAIAAEYGVMEATIQKIKAGKTFKHLDRSSLFLGGPGRRKGNPSFGISPKLDNDQAQAIILDPRPYIEVAADYGVSVHTVSGIKNGRRWSHLDHTDAAVAPRVRKGSQLKITDEQAQAIIEDPRGARVIAEEYGISAYSVSRIKKGEIFPHLDRSRVVINKTGRPRKAA